MLPCCCRRSPCSAHWPSSTAVGPIQPSSGRKGAMVSTISASGSSACLAQGPSPLLMPQARRASSLIVTGCSRPAAMRAISSLASSSSRSLMCCATGGRSILGKVMHKISQLVAIEPAQIAVVANRYAQPTGPGRQPAGARFWGSTGRPCSAQGPGRMDAGPASGERSWRFADGRVWLCSHAKSAG